jgi:hypothetical protein
MRAVNADLPGVGTTVTDPFVQSMRGALTATPASTLNTFLTTCEGHRSTGHVRALDTCLSSALGVTSTDAADGALLGVLDLFFDHARRQLQIN